MATDPALSFRCPETLRELLESRSASTGETVTAVILAALEEHLSKPPAPHVPGALEAAVANLLDGDGEHSAVDRQAALILARIGDVASGTPSVQAIRELRVVVDEKFDSQDAEVAAFRRELAAAVEGSGNGR